MIQVNPQNKPLRQLMEGFNNVLMLSTAKLKGDR